MSLSSVGLDPLSLTLLTSVYVSVVLGRAVWSLVQIQSLLAEAVKQVLASFQVRTTLTQHMMAGLQWELDR